MPSAGTGGVRRRQIMTWVDRSGDIPRGQGVWQVLLRCAVCAVALSVGHNIVRAGGYDGDGKD